MAVPVARPIGVRPSHPGDCRALTLDLVAGYKGYQIEAKAIAGFLASGTASFPLPKDGWTTLNRPTYTSGTAHLQLLHILDGGYAVTDVSNC